MWSFFDKLGFGARWTWLSRRGRRALATGKDVAADRAATMSYGHGLSVTVMQMAHAYLAFARDGELIPVSLTKQSGTPVAGRRVFSAQTARRSGRCSRWWCNPAGLPRRTDLGLPRRWKDRDRTETRRRALHPPLCGFVRGAGADVRPTPGYRGDGG